MALGAGALAPALPFGLLLNGRRADNQGIVDSGADSSAFPLQMMKELGLRKGDCTKELFESAGGSAEQWAYEPGVFMTVLGYRFKCRAVFCDTPAALLGRDDFFRRFRVTIDERAETFTVEPYLGRARSRPR